MDPHQGREADPERRRVEHEHRRRVEREQQQPGEPRPDDLGQESRGTGQRVAGREVFGAQDRGKQRAVRGAEERLARPDREDQGGQQKDRRVSDLGAGREPEDRDQPERIGDPHHPHPGQPVGPDPAQQREQHQRGEPGGKHEPEVRGAAAAADDQRGDGDRASHARRLSTPRPEV